MAYSSLKKLRQIRAGHPAGVVPRVFIETGTQHAVTTRLARQLYDVVETVELSAVLYAAAVARHGHDGIRFHHGDSAELLPKILARYAEPVCIYLDAHWYPNPNVVGADAFPLWAELEAIARRPHADIVIVDDVHSFGTALPAIDWVGVTEGTIVSNLGRVQGTERVADHFVVYRGVK